LSKQKITNVIARNNQDNPEKNEDDVLPFEHHNNHVIASDSAAIANFASPPCRVRDCFVPRNDIDCIKNIFDNQLLTSVPLKGTKQSPICKCRVQSSIIVLKRLL